MIRNFRKIRSKNIILLVVKKMMNKMFSQYLNDCATLPEIDLLYVLVFHCKLNIFGFLTRLDNVVWLQVSS